MYIKINIISYNNIGGDLSMEHHPVAWLSSNKWAGKVFHILFEIDLCQLLQKLFKVIIKVTGLSSVSALAGSDKSVRQDDLLVAVVTNSGIKDCKSPQPSPSNSQHVSPISAACWRDSKNYSQKMTPVCCQAYNVNSLDHLN